MTLVLDFLYMLVMAFTKFEGTSNVLEILVYPSPDKYLSTSETLCMLCKFFANHGFRSWMKSRICEKNPTEISDLE